MAQIKNINSENDVTIGKLYSINGILENVECIEYIDNIKVDTITSFSNIEETVNVTIAQGAVNYTLTTPRANCYYRLVFDCVGLGGDTNGNVQISKVKDLTAE